MGQSTDGIFCYGVKLDEDCDEMQASELSGGKYGDEAEWAAALMGADLGDGFYGKNYDANSAAAARCPVTLVKHCHMEYPMWILGIRGTHEKAWRESPVRLEIPEVDPEWDMVLADYAGRMGLTDKIEGEPGWYLASLWG